MCDNAERRSLRRRTVPRCTTGVDRGGGRRRLAASPTSTPPTTTWAPPPTSTPISTGSTSPTRSAPPSPGQKRADGHGALVLQRRPVPLPRTPSGTAPRWSSAPATPARTTWSVTSSPTATWSSTAGLFSLNQSGAMNESLADTIGEIVDHRNPASTENDDDWVVGEDLPGAGASRSMKDPTLNDLPDRMTSALRDLRTSTTTAAACTTNGGVGNKTAYLISQGGTFNGHTDHRHRHRRPRPGQDRPALPRGDQAAHLRRPVRRPRPRPGSAPAQRARRLERPAASPRRTATRCSAAVAATAARLASDRRRPRPRRGSRSLPDRRHPGAAQAGRRRLRRLRLRLKPSASCGCGLRTRRRRRPRRRPSGTESLFGASTRTRPRGRPSIGDLTSGASRCPTPRGGAYLNFHHAYVFDYDGADATTTVGGGGAEAGQRHLDDRRPVCPGSTVRTSTSWQHRRRLHRLRRRQPRLRLQPGRPLLAGRPDRAGRLPGRG